MSEAQVPDGMDPRVLAGKQALFRLVTARIGVDQHGGDTRFWEQALQDAAEEVFASHLSPVEQRSRLVSFLTGISHGGWQMVLASLLIAPEFGHLGPAVVAEAQDNPDLLSDAGFLGETADEVAAYWQRIAAHADPHGVHRT